MLEINHKRPIYLDRISPYIGQNLIKVLVGQRRVGKSYLLRQLMDLIRVNDPVASIIYHCCPTKILNKGEASIA